MEASLLSKESELVDLLRGFDRAIVAYSGGVDSTYLAAQAHAVLGDRATVATAISASLARRERESASILAAARGWNHIEVATDEVRDERYARNDPDRCYWCKTELFAVLGPLAVTTGAEILVGTNVDDLSDVRPGHRAARESSVRAPLVEVGLTKREVRALSTRLGLPTADKPASACLASRFAYGVRVTEEGLERIDRAEEILRGLGFNELRVRDHGDLARIEVPQGSIERVAEHRDAIARALRDLGFTYVTLDLMGLRSGSMNEVLGPPRIR